MPRSHQPPPAPSADSDAPRQTGRVVRLVQDKGFGFLAGADGKEYFFHKSAAPAFGTLSEGDAITFVPGSGPKGPRAEHVTAAS